MNTLQPRQVDPSSWRLWLRQALALNVRRWPSALTLVASLLLLLLLTDRFLVAQSAPLKSFIALALSLGYLALFVVLAQAADSSKPLTETLAQSIASGLVQLIQIALAAMLVFLTALYFGALLLAWSGQTPPTTGAVTATSAQLGSAFRGWLFFLLLPCAVGYWFVLPLTVCAGTPLLDACRSAVSGWLLNRFLWRLAAIAMLTTLVLPALAVAVAAPLLGAVLYVSFRHVYHGRTENAPVARATTTETVANA